MRNLKTVLVLAALACAACSEKEEPVAPATVVQSTPSKPVVTNVPVTPPAAPAQDAMPGADIPEQVSRLMTTSMTPSKPGPSTRIDTTTPEAFVQSLQAIEREASKEKVDLLRGALMVLQMQTQERVMQIARGRPTPPQFSDQELMQLAFADINGMTTDQIIEHARKIAPNVLPDQ